MRLNWNFQRGGAGASKKSLLWAGEVWIFSGKYTIVHDVPAGTVTNLWIPYSVRNVLKERLNLLEEESWSI